MLRVMVLVGALLLGASGCGLAEAEPPAIDPRAMTAPALPTHERKPPPEISEEPDEGSGSKPRASEKKALFELQTTSDEIKPHSAPRTPGRPAPAPEGSEPDE